MEKEGGMKEEEVREASLDCKDWGFGWDGQPE